MKVSCLQENFAKGLSIVGRAVANRSTLPVLGNVLLSTEKDHLKLSTNNLEIGINCWIGAKVEETGSVTVPAKLLTEFINSLPPERIDLTLDEATQTINARCANFEANLKGIDAQEFPMVHGLDSGQEIIHIDPEALKEMVTQVTFAAANDETRPILTGVLARFDTNTLTMSAADGFRLSKKAISLANTIEEPFEVIIPSRSLAELAKIIGDQDEPIQVAITPNKNQILFHLKDIDLVSQLLEGKFPDVTQIIPNSYTTRSVLDAKSLLSAARVSYLFARDSSNIVKLDITPGDGALNSGHLVLTATSQGLGDNISELHASIEGDQMEIAFNAKYLIDILNVLESAQVAIETTASASPGVVRAIGDDSFIHVIMPMHLSK